MPLATNMAGVNMRLEAGAIRYVDGCSSILFYVDAWLLSEMHWHKTAEWAYILSVRRTRPTSEHRVINLLCI